MSLNIAPNPTTYRMVKSYIHSGSLRVGKGEERCEHVCVPVALAVMKTKERQRQSWKCWS